MLAEVAIVLMCFECCVWANLRHRASKHRTTDHRLGAPSSRAAPCQLLMGVSTLSLSRGQPFRNAKLDLSPPLDAAFLVSRNLADCHPTAALKLRYCICS